MSHQSLVLTNFNQFEIKERNLTELAGEYAIVKILATAICGSDIHGSNGTTGRRFPDQVMGHETCGIVEKVSDKTSDHLIGKRVVINPVISCLKCDQCISEKEYICRSRKVLGVTKGVDGAFAEYIIAPVRNLALISEGVSPNLATAVEPFAVGYHAVIRANIEKNEKILILGGGPIGQAIGLACARLDAGNFLFSEPSKSKRQFISKFGFESVSPDELNSKIKSYGKPTVVFDAVGNNNSFKDAFSFSDIEARIVLVGMDTPNLEFPSYEVSADERSILGSYCYSNNEFTETAKWLSSNYREVQPFITDVTSMSQAPEIFKKLQDSTFEYNRVVISQNE